MIKIGLTGNIASGKSEVEKIIKDLGYCVYDLDDITHTLYKNNDIQNKLLKEFYTTDRHKISDIVFNNKQKLKKLEEIFFPELKNFILNISNQKVVFISGAIIYEAGFDEYFDKIIFVDAAKDIRLKRLIKRNNLSESDALKRINCQNEDNKNKTPFVIENNLTRDELKKQTQLILDRILK